MSSAAPVSALDIEGAFRTTLGVLARVGVPILVLAVLLVGVPSVLLRGDLFSPDVLERGVWTSFGWSGAILTFVQALLEAAVVRLVWRDINGEAALPLGKAISDALGGSVSVLLIAAVIGIAKAIWFVAMIPAFLALLLPGLILLGIGIYLAVAWSVAVPAAVIEGRGAVEALNRSAALTKGDRWLVFAVIILLAILGALLGGLASILPGTIGELVAEAVIGAFSAVLFVVLYAQLKQAKG